MVQLPKTFGELKKSQWGSPDRQGRTVKDELRANLLARLRDAKGKTEDLFPGVVGYEDTVVPQVVNALLSRHNFILLGLRGQAKTRLIRMLTGLLDEQTPYLAGTEIRDNPFRPLSKAGRRILAEQGDDAAIAWLGREQRYVEKLATPDVTIADMIGDIDPIKAAKRGVDIADEENIHYGLLPRANRGIFAVNELPDLAGKIQVGLFNILQEGDVQIKGYPVRLELDVMLVFTANPEDYTARGKIITPLKDRIGSEIRTHYPLTIERGVEITAQEAWMKRTGNELPIEVPAFLPEVVEQIAFLARQDKRIDQRSGVSQRLPISVIENVISNAERRALLAGDEVAVPRILDLYAALPSITGKLELEYEGELKGSEQVARELIRQAVALTYTRLYEGENVRQIIQWFDMGGSLQLPELAPSSELVKELSQIQGLMEKTRRLGLGVHESDAKRASAAEFILEGLYSQRRINRNEEQAFIAAERRRERGSDNEEEEGAGRRPDKRRGQYQ
ncbi:MAG: sigma 54-interacting transcriptional regulator [Bryobacter sp.]|nr:sigma 54-interacting transcriptional regulator [Bryobacter sp.]